MLKKVLLLSAALGLLGLVRMAEPARAQDLIKHKIVYHLSDADVEKTRFVLSNIRNHIAGVGGWSHIEALELVVHGPALRNFLTKTMDPDVKQALEKLQGEGLVFGACGNTMKAMNLGLEQLPPKTEYLPQGGVVRLMELQEKGYVYIRP